MVGLSRVGELPVSELKLDRSLLRGDQRMLGAIAELGRALGLRIVAEGIETLAELALAEGVRRDAAQGFLLGGAVPVDELARVLDRPAVTDGGRRVAALRSVPTRGLLAHVAPTHGIADSRLGVMASPPRLDSHIEAIESAFVAHWSVFGGYPGASLHDEDGVLWFEGPLTRLPYNGVIRTRIDDDRDADAVIARLRERFRDRAAAFMWVVRPSDSPADLARRLAAHGLDLVEQATGMDRDLSTWTDGAAGRALDRAAVTIVEAEAGQALDDYESLIRTYWSVPDKERHHIATLNRHWSGQQSPGVRLVAYLDGSPLGKLFVNLSQLPVVAIYGVAVRPEARGRGVATALMAAGLERAVAAGATSAVLHSSAMARSMYGRLGFVERCTFDVWATAPLFGTHHH